MTCHSFGFVTIEVRSRRTNIRERVHIYASLGRIEAWEESRIASRFGIDVDTLPRGVLVGTVELVGCQPLRASDSRAAGFRIERAEGLHAWLLARPERAARLRTPRKHPQPVFFHRF